MRIVNIPIEEREYNPEVPLKEAKFAKLFKVGEDEFVVDAPKLFRYYYDNQEILQATADVIKKWLERDGDKLVYVEKTGKELGKRERFRNNYFDVGVLKRKSGEVIAEVKSDIDLRDRGEEGLAPSFNWFHEEYLAVIVRGFRFPANSFVVGRDRYNNDSRFYCAFGGFQHRGRKNWRHLNNKRLLVVPALKWEDRRLRLDVIVAPFEVDENGIVNKGKAFWVVGYPYLLNALLYHRIPTAYRLGFLDKDVLVSLIRHFWVNEFLSLVLHQRFHKLVGMIEKNWVEGAGKFAFVIPAGELFDKTNPDDYVVFRDDFEVEIVVYDKTFVIPPGGYEDTVISSRVPDTLWRPEEWEALYWSSYLTDYGKAHGILGEELDESMRYLLALLQEKARKNS